MFFPAKTGPSFLANTSEAERVPIEHEQSHTHTAEEAKKAPEKKGGILVL